MEPAQNILPPGSPGQLDDSPAKQLLDSQEHKEKNRETLKAKRRVREAKNREHINRQRRDLRQRSIPKVSAEEGALFQTQADREEQLGIEDFVVCRVCFGRFETLSSHLMCVHKKSLSEYQEEWKDKKGRVPPFVIPKLRATLSSGRRDRLLGRFYSASATVKGHKGEGPVRKWSMVALWEAGHSKSAIGKELNRKLTTVYFGLKALALEGKPAIYSFGEPLTFLEVARLRKTLRLTGAEFADLTGVPKDFANRPGAADRRITPRYARKIITWRDNTLRELPVGSRQNDRLNPAPILKVFFPNLRSDYSLLHRAFCEIRKYLRAAPETNVEDLQDYLCKEARLEVVGKAKGDLFKRFLRWAGELMPFLEANIGRLRGLGEPRLIVCEAIGCCCGNAVSSRAVLNAIFEKLQMIPATMLHERILRLSQSRRTQQPLAELKGKKSGGREKTQLSEQLFAKQARAVFEVKTEMDRGMTVRRKTERESPLNDAIHRNALAAAGFNQKQIQALMSADNAMGAAQRYVALIFTDSKHPHGRKVSTIQNACSKYQTARKQGLL